MYSQVAEMNRLFAVFKNIKLAIFFWQKVVPFFKSASVCTYINAFTFTSTIYLYTYINFNQQFFSKRKKLLIKTYKTTYCRRQFCFSIHVYYIYVYIHDYAYIYIYFVYVFIHKCTQAILFLPKDYFFWSCVHLRLLCIYLQT